MSENESGNVLSRTIFDYLSPSCGTVLAAIIADILAAGLDPVQIAVLAAFITSVGDNLGYIAAQMELNLQLNQEYFPGHN